MTTPEVLAFLKGDRQWFREHRIAHARLQVAKASPDDIMFWLDVLEALGDSAARTGAKNVN
jgi:hypothetical protein